MWLAGVELGLAPAEHIQVAQQSYDTFSLKMSQLASTLGSWGACECARLRNWLGEPDTARWWQQHLNKMDTAQSDKGSRAGIASSAHSAPVQQCLW
jgi:hypothetical protein